MNDHESLRKALGCPLTSENGGMHYRENSPAVPQDSRRVVQEWSHDYLDEDFDAARQFLRPANFGGGGLGGPVPIGTTQLQV